MFYVNHITESTQSCDPRDDKSIDYGTNLPRGWEETFDQNGITYFFEKTDLRATYQRGTVVSNSVCHEFMLERRPQRGEIPAIKDSNIKMEEIKPASNHDGRLKLFLDEPDATLEFIAKAEEMGFAQSLKSRVPKRSTGNHQYDFVERHFDQNDENNAELLARPTRAIDEPVLD